MIEQLLTAYREKLCKQEIMLLTNLYNASNDIKSTELFADKLAAKGYGLAMNRASPIDIKAVNCEIIKYDIAELTHTSIEYINSLPYDICDELIDFYNININMNCNDFSDKLLQIMNMNYPDETLSEKIVTSDINRILIHKNKPFQNKKPSLLKRLRKYEELVKRCERI